MLNGLQTSSKTLPLDISVAKLQPMDAGTTETVSFGKFLKLKEKQLQQEQETSASFVAAAFAPLQTTQLVAALPIQIMETVETAPEGEVSKASTDAISQTVTTPIERSDLLSLTQAPKEHDGVTESIYSMFPTVFESVNENNSQQALVQPEISDALSPTSFVKTPTVAITASPITDRPAEFIEKDLTSKVAKIAPAVEQVPASVPSPKAETISALGTIKPVEPTAENHISSSSATAKASPLTFDIGTITKIDVAGEAIKTHTKNATGATGNPEISTQPLPVNAIPPEVKTSDGTDSPIAPAAKTVIMPNEESGTKENAVLAFNRIKTNNSESALFPNQPFQVRPNQEVDKSPSSLINAIVVDRQEFGLQILEVPIESRSTKTQSTETNKTSEFGNAPGFVQPEIKENIRFYQTDHKDNNAASRPLPVKTTDGVPTRNSPKQIGTDSSIIRQSTSSFKAQQSDSFRPSFISSSSFAPEIDATEKMQMTLAVEDQSKGGTLLLHNTVEEIVSTDEIDVTEIPVTKSAFKHQFATPTDVNLRSVNVTSANSTLETPVDPNSPHEVAMPTVNTFGQEQDNFVRSYQSGNQAVKTQAEQSPLEKMGTNETEYDQTAHSPSIPVTNELPLADDKASYPGISTSERAVDRLSVTQGKIDLKKTLPGSAGQVGVIAGPDKKAPDTANIYGSNTPTQTGNTESEDTRSEADGMTTPLKMPSPSPIGGSSDLPSTLAEDAPSNLQFADEFSGDGSVENNSGGKNRQ